MARYGMSEASRKRAIRRAEVYLGDVPVTVAENVPPGYIKVIPGNGVQTTLTDRVIKATVDRQIGRTNIVVVAEAPHAKVGDIRVTLKEEYRNHSPMARAILKATQPPKRHIPFVAGPRGRGVPVFTPGIDTALELYRENPTFRAQIDSGNYVYVDGAFCLNRKDFVTVDPIHGAKMTAYAKNNAEECVMRFGIARVKVERYGDIKHYRPQVGRGKAKSSGRPLPRMGGGSSYTPSFRIDLPNAVLHGEPIAVAEVVELGGSVRKSKAIDIDTHGELCRAIKGKCFADAIKELMSILNFTLQDVEDATGIGMSKLKKFRDKDNRATIYQQDVLALIIGLHLPPPIGEYLIESARIQFDTSDEDNLYGLIIGTMTNKSMKEINEILVQRGYSSIPKQVKPKSPKEN